MADELDYDLVVAQGTVPQAAGRFGRRRGTDRLPDVPFGLAQVLRSTNGTLVEASAGRTAGERYWSHDDTWFHVDVRPHGLRFEFRHPSPRSTADHVILVEVTAQVISASTAIQLNVHSARPHVLSRLSVLVDDATAAFDAAVDDAVQEAVGRSAGQPGASVAVLEERAAMRREVRERLRAGKSFEIDGWLRCQIVAGRSELDADTEKHLIALRQAERSSEMATAEYRTQRVRDDGNRELRMLWTDHFGDRLGAPLSAAVEIVAADPSPGNIERVVRQLNSEGRESRSEFITILQSLINKDLVGELGDISTFHAILTELQGNGRSSDPAIGGKVIVDSDRLSPIDAPPAGSEETVTKDKQWGG